MILWQVSVFKKTYVTIGYWLIRFYPKCKDHWHKPAMTIRFIQCHISQIAKIKKVNRWCTSRIGSHKQPFAKRKSSNKNSETLISQGQNGNYAMSSTNDRLAYMSSTNNRPLFGVSLTSRCCCWVSVILVNVKDLIITCTICTYLHV